MKKEYQKPVMTVVVLQPTTILAGSNGDSFHTESVSASSAMSRQGGGWDDDDE